MKLYLRHTHLDFIHGYVSILFGFIVLTILFILGCEASTADLNIKTCGSGLSANGNKVDGEINGPTITMSYREENFAKNPLASFMYFIPLLSLSPVDDVSSPNNDQQIGIVSHNINLSSESFDLICEFVIRGSGFYQVTFDPAGIIATQKDKFKKGERLENMLEYIKVDGEGCGVIEVKGRITDSARIVTNVNINFNARGNESNLTIGLYDVEPKDGEYEYQNRSNEKVARVNRLSFEKTEETPRMRIKIASIAGEKQSAGFFGKIKGMLANFFIKPPKVTRLGNTTMLDFGKALLQKKSQFTFPKAKNIRQGKMLATDNT
ncbi:MAG: hypothetical protein AVO38_01255 [delta proteobacterium ML8_D]|nr:MAG: hypothetical protein AVO38_01255 [delta proteobacterium ML8_D]